MTIGHFPIVIGLALVVIVGQDSQAKHHFKSSTLIPNSSRITDTQQFYLLWVNMRSISLFSCSILKGLVI